MQKKELNDNSKVADTQEIADQKQKEARSKKHRDRITKNSREKSASRMIENPIKLTLDDDEGSLSNSKQPNESLSSHDSGSQVKASGYRGQPKHLFWRKYQGQQNNLDKREEESTKNSDVHHNQRCIIPQNINPNDKVVIDLTSDDDKEFSSGSKSEVNQPNTSTQQVCDDRSVKKRRLGSPLDVDNSHTINGMPKGIEGNTSSFKLNESFKARADSEIKSLLIKYSNLGEGAFLSHDVNKKASDGNQNQQNNLDRVKITNLLT